MFGIESMKALKAIAAALAAMMMFTSCGALKKVSDSVDFTNGSKTGTVMLIVDHIINGELTLRFPFFTALNELNGADTILREMLSVGVPMSLVLTAVWTVYALLQARPAKA